MKTIVRAKHWQIFAVLLGVAWIDRLTEIKVLTGDTNEIVADISFLSVIVVSVGWPLLTGLEINRRQEEGKKMNFMVPVFAGLLAMLITGSLRFLLTIDQTIELMEGKKAVLIGILLFVVAFMILVCAYAARALKVGETKGDVEINDYFGDLWRFFFWPVGVWFVQPRVNKLFESGNQGDLPPGE